MRKLLFFAAILTLALVAFLLLLHHSVPLSSIAPIALNHRGDTRYLASRWNGWYRPGSNKCNQAVADWIQTSGRPRPRVPGHFGIIPRDPSAHEWADPRIPIPGWSAPFDRALARPGDVIAQQHGPIYAHVGIVVAPGRTISAYGDTTPQGIVLENDWGFRTAPGANGESATDPPPVVRRSLQPTP